MIDDIAYWRNRAEKAEALLAKRAARPKVTTRKLEAEKLVERLVLAFKKAVPNMICDCSPLGECARCQLVKLLDDL